MSYEIEALKAAIAIELGYAATQPPVQISPAEAAQVLGVKESTLAVWRSTGRYQLPFSKSGRLIRYRVSDLAEFINRTYDHTGETIEPWGTHG